MSSLADKVALVTGASRGIGEATARLFAQEGARVVICGRKQETLNEVAERIGGNITPLACHVGDAAQIRTLVERIDSDFGRIDILVNNAATNVQQGPCLEATEAQFDKMVEVNLKSVFRLIQAIAPRMAAGGGGSIINVASVAGLRPQSESLLYSMTKAALIMMTRSYALELGPKGIRVNAIAPGLIQTKLSEYFWKDEARRNDFVLRQPIRRLGQPEEIAGIMLLLASDRGSFITGEILTADGGFLLT